MYHEWNKLNYWFHQIQKFHKTNYSIKIITIIHFCDKNSNTKIHYDSKRREKTAKQIPQISIQPEKNRALYENDPLVNRYVNPLRFWYLHIEPIVPPLSRFIFKSLCIENRPVILKLFPPATDDTFLGIRANFPRHLSRFYPENFHECTAL